MNRVTINQNRVATLLKDAGWPNPKKDIFAVFLEYHDRVPGLAKKQGNHKPAKSGIATWYDYESPRYLTVAQAEKEIAIKLGELLGLPT